MKPSPYTAIGAAITDLGWCNTVPHTIEQVIGIHAEATRTTTRPMRHGMTNDEILASISRRTEGGGGKGGHSDPTAMAALWGEPDAADGDDTVATIDAAIALASEAAVDLDHLCSDTLHLNRWNPPAQPGRQAKLAATISRLTHLHPNLNDTLVHLHGEDLTEAHTLVHSALAENAAWLVKKAEAIWCASRGDQRIVAVQRTIEPCRICGPWRSGTIAGPSGLCEQCKNFRYHHKCQPTEPIVRRWEYGDGPTPGMILEAKAAGIKKPRKAKAS